MRLTISHTTRYGYGEHVRYGLQQLRLTPTDTNAQRILDWSLDIEGGQHQTRFNDHHGNRVDLVSLDGGNGLTVTVNGEVETTDTAGVLGHQSSAAPLWYFLRPTALTEPGDHIQALVDRLDRESDPIAQVHALSALIAQAVPYDIEAGDVSASAETALQNGSGVCQDHAHIFLAAARSLGIPARYVSGYLMMNDRIDQDASHAWVEAYTESLGWIGFDISNQISPDERYVRLATGLDYAQAAPTSGLVYGGGSESMIVSIQVQQ